MAFSYAQCKALNSKLRRGYVKTKESNGVPIAYLEGWHVIAEANRIFGFDGWDRVTLSPHSVWSGMQKGQFVCVYTAKVRITVRAGETVIVREGIGTGTGRGPSAEVAHEMALKAAETDATKRALATFGNPFGLALYDKEKGRVTKPRRLKTETLPEETKASPVPAIAPALVLAREDGTEVSFREPAEFLAAVLDRIPQLTSLDALYGLWKANATAFAELKQRASDVDPDPVERIIMALKDRARALGKRSPSDGNPTPQRQPGQLAFPKEKRLRSKEHLAFVASQPCLICGRRPAHAHHLRFAQPRAMGLKVSDEFTVPLCNADHDAVHRTGDERAWWARHGILDPLKIAGRLWAASRGHYESLEQEPSGAKTTAETDLSAEQTTSFWAVDRAPGSIKA